MKQRAITAVFFVAAMLGGVYGGPVPFLLLCAVIMAGCIWEFTGLLLADEPGKIALRVVAIGLGLAVVFADGKGTLTPFRPTIFTAAAFGLLLFEMFRASKSPFQNVATILAAIYYIALPIRILQNIASDSVDELIYHPNRVFGLLWLVWTNDTAAYIIGSKIGRTKLFERISPKKTWEGTVGGAIFTVGMAWVLAQVFPSDFTVNQWLMLGAVVGMFGTLGDLVESMLKRSVGVKDSGTLLPGHGGLLDRFDAFIFVLPFAWLALQMF